MYRTPSFLLLAVLLGGIGASSIHEAHHAAEWAKGQTEHAGEHADGIQAPCVDGAAHDIDCAVCSGLSAAVLEDGTPADLEADLDGQIAADAAFVEYSRAATPARGPPAVA